MAHTSMLIYSPRRLDMRSIGIPELLLIGAAMAFVAILVVVLVWAVMRGKRE